MGVAAKRTLTKTRRKTRDVDQIKADLWSSKHLAQYKNSKVDEELPGLGRNYCIECARWFDNEITLAAHRRGKPHKRRAKQLREEEVPNASKLPGADRRSRADSGLRDDTAGAHESEESAP